ncbi:unnamed protein product, partial [Meganyctiphanes norvegica]
ISIVLVSLLSICTGAPRGGVFNPYEDGPFTIQHVHVGSLFQPGLDENLDIWAPTEAGTYPIMYYLTGGAMMTAGTTYSQMLSHVASHGLVIVTMNRLSMAAPSEKVPYFEDTMNWAELNLEEKLYGDGIPVDVHLDFKTLIGAAHSAGNHVLVEYLKHTCGNFLALIFHDPVDGADPMGIMDDWCITPGEFLNFDIPTYHLSAGLDPAVGDSPSNLGMSCAPAHMSNERFWNALNRNSPRWSVNATKFGHMDFVDPEFNTGGFCAANNEATDEDFDAYRKFVAGQTINFIAAVFEDDCTPYLNEIENPSNYIVEGTVRVENSGDGCPTPYCTWEPLPSPAP